MLKRTAKFVGLTVALMMALSLLPAASASADSDLLTATLTTTSPQVTGGQPLVGCNSVWSGGTFYYGTATYNVPSDGVYTIDDYGSANGYFDGWLVLYNGAFDPADPLTNCVAAVDEHASVTLLAGGYTVVLMNHVSGTTGTVEFTMLPASPWFEGYRDGRINYAEVYSPVALYAIPTSSGAYNLDIYRIGSNGGTLALTIGADQIAAALATPGLVSLGATADNFIRVTKLPDGQFLVEAGADAEGKTTYILFDQVCPGYTCASYVTWQTP